MKEHTASLVLALALAGCGPNPPGPNPPTAGDVAPSDCGADDLWLFSSPDCQGDQICFRGSGTANLNDHLLAAAAVAGTEAHWGGNVKSYSTNTQAAFWWSQCALQPGIAKDEPLCPKYHVTGPRECKATPKAFTKFDMVCLGTTCR